MNAELSKKAPKCLNYLGDYISVMLQKSDAKIELAISPHWTGFRIEMLSCIFDNEPYECAETLRMIVILLQTNTRIKIKLDSRWQDDSNEMHLHMFKGQK